MTEKKAPAKQTDEKTPEPKPKTSPPVDRAAEVEARRKAFLKGS
jgi:hypothetical protein